MEEQLRRVCRKCLLRESDERAYFKNLFAYIENLPREDKVPEEVYGARLALCRDCENLLSGMCRLCGCYVELRAAMRVRSCPAVPARWLRMERAADE